MAHFLGPRTFLLLRIPGHILEQRADSSNMEGYTTVARLMGTDKELASFRRFAKLNMQDLLYHQAELVQLEADYWQTVNDDAGSSDRHKKHYGRDWYIMSRCTGRSSGGNRDGQWAKWLEIRAKLTDYNKCLQRQLVLAQAEPPRDHELSIFREWLTRPYQGNFPLIGVDRDSWSNEYAKDLIAMNPPPKLDSLTTWFNTKLIPLRVRRLPRFRYPWSSQARKSSAVAGTSYDPESGLVSYNDRRIKAFFDVLGTVVSSLFPITAIIVLYFVASLRARLGVTAAFTALFSAALALITECRRYEIFAATTAFAAIQVVFIGTTDSSGSGKESG